MDKTYAPTAQCSGESSRTILDHLADLGIDEEHVALLASLNRFDGLRRKDNLLDEGVASVFGLGVRRSFGPLLSRQEIHVCPGSAVACRARDRTLDFRLEPRQGSTSLPYWPLVMGATYAKERLSCRP